jgi:pimeloyl-ACP methyl ester carboxylesterase
MKKKERFKEWKNKYEEYLNRYEELIDKYGDAFDIHDWKNSYKQLKSNLTSQLTTYISYNDFGEISEPFEDKLSEKLKSFAGNGKNPVILIHGFFGAQLTDSKTGMNLWGDFNIMDTFRISGEKMKKLAHPMQPGKQLYEMNDSIKAVKMLEKLDISFAGFPLRFPAYRDMINVLVKSGFSEDKENLFIFAYDWRKDLAVNAASLADFIDSAKKQVRKNALKNGIRKPDIKFDIVAHSMGGLITRYYLRYARNLNLDNPTLDWSGAKNIQRVIIVGTPNAGYLDTFLEMVKGSPIQPYPVSVLGTLPSYYQMLPNSEFESVIDAHSGKPLNIFDVELWIKMKWGLAEKRNDSVLKTLLPEISSESKRREIALEHLEKCLKRADAFINKMGEPENKPQHLSMHLICGNGIKTTRRASVTPKGRVDVTEFASGDGKVLTSSAMHDIRQAGSSKYLFKSPVDWDNIILLRSAHMGITKAPAFEDNVRFLLTKTPES